MPNGDSLKGFLRCTQNSLIVPLPGSSRYFYVFMPNVTPNGFYYSIVDICRDDGYGDIIPSKKNIPLMPGIGTEKVAAVRHANGQDYWVLTHQRYSNKFFSFRLSPNGIIDTVISSTGTAHVSTKGEMKISPDGSRLAVSATTDASVLIQSFELFDFDKTTGMVSNPRSLVSNGAIIYGLAFSPDNSKLYASFSGHAWPYVYGVYQFDLNAGGGQIDSINASVNIVYLVGNSVGSSVCNLQLGPDNKVYGTQALNGRLFRIANPNAYGPACNLDTSLGCGSGALSSTITAYSYSNTKFVCPTCPQHYQTTVTPPIKNLCPGDTATLCGVASWANYQWSTGETSSCIHPTSAGVYYITVTNPNGCSAEFGPAIVQSYPNVTVSISVSGNILTAYGGSSYQWYLNGNPIPGATGQQYIATEAGSYVVEVTDHHGCSASSLTEVITGLDEGTNSTVKVQLLDGGSRLQFVTTEPLSATSIYDLTGKLLLDVKLPSNNSIDVSSLTPGLYVLAVEVRGSTKFLKWVKR
jgi:hypothetical protein